MNRQENDIKDIYEHDLEVSQEEEIIDGGIDTVNVIESEDVLHSIPESKQTFDDDDSQFEVVNKEYKEDLNDSYNIISADDLRAKYDLISRIELKENFIQDNLKNIESQLINTTENLVVKDDVTKRELKYTIGVFEDDWINKIKEALVSSGYSVSIRETEAGTEKVIRIKW